jgi:MarR family transcriptional regulator, organic hydroperoxide resistance regulator
MTDTQRILDAIRRLVRQLRLFDRAAQSRLGLSAAQLFILAELGKTPAISLSEIAERTHTDQSSASTVVTRLVEAGLVARERSSRDARRLVLTLTRAGRAALRKAPPVAQQVLVDLIDAMPPAERKRFADTFTEIVEEMGAEKSAPMLFEDEGHTAAARKRK